MAVKVKPISKISSDTVIRCLNCGYTDKAAKWKEYKGKCFNCKSEAYKEYGSRVNNINDSGNPLADFLNSAVKKKAASGSKNSKTKSKKGKKTKTSSSVAPRRKDEKEKKKSKNTRNKKR